jgi:hypothetical protein
MSQDEIFEQVVKILTPYVKNQEALDTVGCRPTSSTSSR